MLQLCNVKNQPKLLLLYCFLSFKLKNYPYINKKKMALSEQFQQLSALCALVGNFFLPSSNSDSFLAELFCSVHLMLMQCSHGVHAVCSPTVHPLFTWCSLNVQVLFMLFSSSGHVITYVPHSSPTVHMLFTCEQHVNIA